MNAYLRLFRLGNAVMGCVGLLVAAFIAAGTGMVDHWFPLAVCVAVVFLFISGGNTLNDGIDAEIDKESHPDRPVPQGLVSAERARKLGMALLLMCIPVSVITLDLHIIVIVSVAAVLMIAYENGLKQRGFVGNMTIAVLTGMLFLVGSAAVEDWTANLFPALLVIAVSVGREIAKDIEDMEGDKDRRTLPMSIGVRGAAAVSCVFTVAGVVLSFIPLYLGTVAVYYWSVVIADAFFVVAAFKVFKDPHGSQKMSKFGMLFGLVAFIAGALRRDYGYLLRRGYRIHGRCVLPSADDR